MSNVPGRKKETAIALRMRSRIPCFSFSFEADSLRPLFLVARFPRCPSTDDDSHGRRVYDVLFFVFFFTALITIDVNYTATQQYRRDRDYTRRTGIA